jgi:2,4-dienoyl-CoA reductase (NADPH2)
VVIASGVTPRQVDFEGADKEQVVSYLDVLKHKRYVGKRVAIIGAGGIGFDTAEYLLQEGESATMNPELFYRQWGIDPEYKEAGGVKTAQHEEPIREIYLLQRKNTAVGANLGKTSGWIHRAGLKNHQVKMMSGVRYDKFDEDGLHIHVNDEAKLLPVDHVVVCAGQESFTAMYDALKQVGKKVHLIGGAKEAGELDAKRAIRQGAELAAKI